MQEMKALSLKSRLYMYLLSSIGQGELQAELEKGVAYKKTCNTPNFGFKKNCGHNI